LIIDPLVHEDERGYFVEMYHKERYREAGVIVDFVQDSYSCSQRNVLRGLHYQLPHPQGKLVWVVKGDVFDVAVDLRRNSATFGRWISVRLSETNHRQVYLPPGFAHGFCVLSEVAEVVYKSSNPYYSEHQHVLRWDDPELAISWPMTSPILSERDKNGCPFAEAATFD
jgi:dTDP-4-dehydrorhamnose 3,5-epimerase